MSAPNQDRVDKAIQQTRCDRCKTVFEVPDDVLKSSDTRVRCGECLTIFDAVSGLLQTPYAQNHNIEADRLTNAGNEMAEESGSTGLSGETSEITDATYSNLDVTFSDFDLFSDDAELPEFEFSEEIYMNPMSGTVRLDFDQVADATLDESDTTPVDSTGSESTHQISADLPRDAAIAKLARRDLKRPLSSLVNLGDLTAKRSKVPGGMSEQDADSLMMHANVEFVDTHKKPGAARSDVLSGNLDLLADGLTDNAESENTIFSDPASRITENAPIRTQDFPGKGRRNDRDTDTVRHLSDEEPLEDSSEGYLPVDLVDRNKSGLTLGQIAVMVGTTALVVALLGGLYLYRERTSLANNQAMRPLLGAMCVVAGCEVPAPFEPASYRVLRRSVFSHPVLDNALVINIVFRNDADFAQRYPILTVLFHDLTGSMVASRDFPPSVYLAKGRLQETDGLLTARTSINISLEVRDPGADVSDFTLQLK